MQYIVYMKPANKKDIKKLGLEDALTAYTEGDIKRFYYEMIDEKKGALKEVSKLPKETYKTKINVGEYHYGRNVFGSSQPRLGSSQKNAYVKGKYAYVGERAYSNWWM